MYTRIAENHLSMKGGSWVIKSSNQTSSEFIHDRKSIEPNNSRPR